jgi:DNA polymerase I
MEEDGRVHPTLMLHGTRTGRLAHKVIANIPRDKRIRGMYQAAKGHVIIKCDEDQAELRALAALSGDPELCAIYRSNTRKLHREVSDDIWGAGNWHEEQYMRAKALNFGIIYGRQAESISTEFKIPAREAQGYINYWKQKFPVAWAFLEKCRKAVTRGQTLITPFGSKKRHGIVTGENLNALQNEACNFPFQNVASNIALYAAISIGPKLRERGAYIILLVHDEILVECPDDLVNNFSYRFWARTKEGREFHRQEIAAGIRTCSKCGLTMPLDEFYKRTDSSPFIMAECKTCFRARIRRSK